MQNAYFYESLLSHRHVTSHPEHCDFDLKMKDDIKITRQSIPHDSGFHVCEFSQLERRIIFN